VSIMRAHETSYGAVVSRPASLRRRRPHRSAWADRQTQRKNPSGLRSNRVNTKEDTGVIVPVGSGQGQAAVTAAPVLLPRL
jgi:hypothetical protein